MSNTLGIGAIAIFMVIDQVVYELRKSRYAEDKQRELEDPVLIAIDKKRTNKTIVHTQNQTLELLLPGK